MQPHDQDNEASGTQEHYETMMSPPGERPFTLSGAQFVRDVTIPDDTCVPLGDSFTKTWRVRNSGKASWQTDYSLRHVGGVAMTEVKIHSVPALYPGEEVDISLTLTAPDTPGTYISDWRFQDGNGNFFGENIFTQIIAQAVSVTAVGTSSDSQFVKEKQHDKPQLTLQTGMNINPDAPYSNPVDDDALQGTDWVRFVFKLAARENPLERDDIHQAFAQYDPFIRKYHDKGVKSLIVLNQETVWGNAPWMGNNDWHTFGNQLALVAQQIAKRYQPYGASVAYEIWNEGDLPGNPASVYVEPEQFAVVLQMVADAIRLESPRSPLVFGGLATGPEQSISYLHRCWEALGRVWPVDAIGIHPYGRWATRAPFDWGQQFGTLAQALTQYEHNFPDMPFWITEMGVAADNEIGSEHYAAIADYMTDVFQHVAHRHTHIVPVLIWFAWSDWMRHAGIVQRDGRHKEHVYEAFQVVIKNK